MNQGNVKTQRVLVEECVQVDRKASPKEIVVRVMATSTVTQVDSWLAELGSLKHTACKGHYQRIKLAARLQANREWVDGRHEGNLQQAIRFLEDEFFHDIVGTAGLSDLIVAYHRFPEEVKWAENDYNLRTMVGLVPKIRRSKKKDRRVSREEYEECRRQLLEATERVQFLEDLYREYIGEVPHQHSTV